MGQTVNLTGFDLDRAGTDRPDGCGARADNRDVPADEREQRHAGGDAVRMRHVRIELCEANAFVEALHRHHKPVIGHLFSLGAEFDGAIVGVAIVGRPVARMRDDGMTAEVTRLCTDGTRNACSFLYGASARAAFALGFKRIGTYILADELGTSLYGAGWRLLGERGGGTWNAPCRARVDKHPTQRKLLFEATP